MTRYLLDTNILLRSYDPASPSYKLAVEAVFKLIQRGDECVLTSQVLIEFWVVATRPVEVNGLGWSVEQTRGVVETLLGQLPLLEESEQIFPNWFNLVVAGRITGKRTHDIRLIAVMLAYQITHILTFNVNDFTIASAPNLIIVHPQDLV